MPIEIGNPSMQEENLLRGRAFDFDGGIGDLVWVRLFFAKPLVI